jgi:poly(A) polymerase Pap1
MNLFLLKFYWFIYSYQIYQPIDISKEYGLYLRLDILSNDPANMHKWVGLVQNKLRILTLALEKIENLSFRPLPKLLNGGDENSKIIIIGLKYKPKAHTENIENGKIQGKSILNFLSYRVIMRMLNNKLCLQI